MHTVIVIGAGVALLIASLLLGHAWGHGMTGAAAGAKVFIGLWLLCAFVNMAVGVKVGVNVGGSGVQVGVFVRVAVGVEVGGGGLLQEANLKLPMRVRQLKAVLLE